MAIEAAPVQLSPHDYDAVVFDMDGVITDTATAHFMAWKRMFDAYLQQRGGRNGADRRPFDRGDYLRFVDGKQRNDGVASFLASRGIDVPDGRPADAPDRETVWGLANRKNESFLHVLVETGVQAFPSSVELVRNLQRAGMGTAVVTASRNARQVLEAAGIGDLFAVRVDGVEAERLALPGKPSPALFLEAARRLGAAPERAVVVEDAIAGVRAGHDGGFGLVVGVDRAGQADALRAGGADVVVSDLAQVQVRA